MGTVAVGIQFRYLSHEDEALWPCCRVRFAVVVEYVEIALLSSSAAILTFISDFVISYNTPTWITTLGWKIFIMYATLNFGAMATFSLIIPETKGRSLEEMDVIFGAVSAETRQEDIERQRVVLGGVGDGDFSSIGSDGGHKI